MLPYGYLRVDTWVYSTESTLEYMYVDIYSTYAYVYELRMSSLM